MNYVGNRIEKTYQYLDAHSNWLKDEKYDKEVIASLIAFFIVQENQNWKDLEEK